MQINYSHNTDSRLVRSLFDDMVWVSGVASIWGERQIFLGQGIFEQGDLVSLLMRHDNYTTVMHGMHHGTLGYVRI